jgi:methylated-DNA-protein-cysteine methyltransferase related protein
MNLSDLPRRKNRMRPKILATIRKIPRGRVSTYGAVARAAGYPGGARRVAWVLRGSRELPWHRVLGAGGEIKLTGDAAFEQRFRLQSEGVSFRGRRVDMKRHEHRFGKTKLSSRKRVSP